MKEEYFDHLKEIVKSMELSQNFVHGHTLESFKDDEKTQFAVIRCLEIIYRSNKTSAG